MGSLMSSGLRSRAPRFMMVMARASSWLVIKYRG